MSLNQIGLGFVFTAKDLASGVIGRVKNSFNELEGASASATKTFKSGLAEFGKVYWPSVNVTGELNWNGG